MTDRYVKADGSNTSPYETWAKAATSLATATGAAAAGETVYVDNAFNETITTDQTYTLAAGVRVVSTSDTTNQPPTTYATGATISTTTSGADVTINGSGAFYGVTFTMGDSADNCKVYFAQTDPSHIVMVDCAFQFTGAASGSGPIVGYVAANYNVFTEFRNCSFTWTSTSQIVTIYTGCRFLDCDMSAGSTHPTTLFAALSYALGYFEVIGCDLSDIATVLEATPDNWVRVDFRQCKLKAAATVFAPSVAATGEAWVFDCNDGDSHIQIAHYDYRGSTVVSTSIYVSDNIADSNLSWVVAGNANTTKATPYYSPWISVYHTGTSEITPYLECVRSGSATAYNEDEVWIEVTGKVVSSSTDVTLYTNRSNPLTTGAANENSSKTGSDWTGENATSWFGKLALNAGITPAEAGYISARVGISGNHTVYVDPQIRGLG